MFGVFSLVQVNVTLSGYLRKPVDIDGQKKCQKMRSCFWLPADMYGSSFEAKK